MFKSCYRVNDSRHTLFFSAGTALIKVVHPHWSMQVMPLKNLIKDNFAFYLTLTDERDFPDTQWVAVKTHNG